MTIEERADAYVGHPEEIGQLPPPKGGGACNRD